MDSGEIRARTIGQIGPNGESSFESLESMTLDELALVTNRMLVNQGLYAKEATSMVETWKQSWFSEEGTRVLYIVPEQTTDELLPLTIEPSPDQTLRVLVGRMEILPPDAEQQLIKAVRVSKIASDSAVRTEANRLIAQIQE